MTTPTPVPSEVAETTAGEREGTCPSLCVERSHPGREHDETTDGCYCWELCAMGPTCPGANAGLEWGCWRATTPAEPDAGEVEALAKVIDSQIDGTVVRMQDHHPNCDGSCAQCPIETQEWGDTADLARAILASDWLAALLDRAASVGRGEGL